MLLATTNGSLYHTDHNVMHMQDATRAVELAAIFDSVFQQFTYFHVLKCDPAELIADVMQVLFRLCHV